MAIKSEFEKFKSGMTAMSTTTKSLGAALRSKENEKQEEPVKPTKRQVSFYIDDKLMERLGILKAKSRKSFSTLYEEAISDLLGKYGE